MTPVKEIEENKKTSKRKNTKITLIRVSSEVNGYIFLIAIEEFFCVSVAGTT